METSQLKVFRFEDDKVHVYVAVTKYVGVTGTYYIVSTSCNIGPAAGSSTESFETEALALDTADLYINQMRPALVEHLMLVVEMKRMFS